MEKNVRGRRFTRLPVLSYWGWRGGGVNFSYISLYEDLANRLLESEIVGSASRVIRLAGQKDRGSGIGNFNMVDRCWGTFLLSLLYCMHFSS